MLHKLHRCCFCSFFAVVFAGSCHFASIARASEKDRDPPGASPEDVTRWRDLKFGMFIHWGPVSLQGTEIGWSRAGERRGRTGTGTVPVEIYDNLFKKFNPVKFDPKEWVGVAKAAGMRYMVLTTRHHDGFSLFDSKYSDYKITNPQSPYRKDVVKMLSQACRDGGLVWGAYYSQPDWRHPDYLSDNHAKFIEYMHGQVREVLTNYGKTDIIWFDGLGRTAKDWNAAELFGIIRAAQPQIMINNRCGFPADFDTPEQGIGRMQTERPWETCMTICSQWSWKPEDKMKSLKQCLQTLVKTVGGDGNLLFNVGPMPDGRIEPRQVERLKEMGAWLEQYGESIYGTRGGPFWRGPWGASTQKKNSIYLHLLNPEQGTVRLPPIPKKILSATALTGGTAAVRQTASVVEVSVPVANRRDIDTIVELHLDGPASDIPVAGMDWRSAAKGKAASASSVSKEQDGKYGPENAFDGDPKTCWAAAKEARQGWLEVDLGKETTVNRILIWEGIRPHRIQAFEILAQRGDAWEQIYSGKRIGQEVDVEFAPVTASKFRLNISQSNEGPSIGEFRLFSPQ
jgi:alpha-L-fucosidase